MKCEICNKEYAHLGLHINYQHKDITQKEYYDRYLKKDGEGFCYTCNTPLPFLNLIKGYKHYCNAKCEHADPHIMEKAKQTYKIRTGYDHNMHNPESKDRVKKTTEKRYGGIGFASKELAQKVLKTYNKQNGTNIESVYTISHSTPEIEQRRKETRIKNNGGTYISDEHRAKLNETSTRPEIIEKKKQTRKKLYGDKYISNTAYEKLKKKSYNTYSDVCMVDFNNDDDDRICTCHCNLCGNDYKINLLTLRTRRYANQVPCTICNPIGSHIFKSTSNEEQELYDYISSLYDGIIIRNDRTVLSNKELDIYLPGKKLAFEFDGLYWHNEITKPNNYHVSKTNECESKGIQLIHVFEDDWRYKQDIVKSRIRSLLGLTEKIYARKCELKPVSSKDASVFLNDNHLQGTVNSKYRYGLYYNNELVSLMTFGKSRFGNIVEMHRFCNKRDVTVIGGASRLFSHFITEHPEITEIESFADRCWSIGNLYEKIGFKKEGITAPAYYYIIDYVRHNRMEFQKHKLVKAGFDKTMSEHEIMLSREIYRIYDCGNIKYVYSRN